MAIIVDEVEQEDVNYIIMADDGTGVGINIPSMIINKEPGDKLIEFLTTNKEQVIRKAALHAKFIINKPDSRVEYDYWFTSSNA
jgi:hypothetical protein